MPARRAPYFMLMQKSDMHAQDEVEEEEDEDDEEEEEDDEDDDEEDEDDEQVRGMECEVVPPASRNKLKCTARTVSWHDTSLGTEVAGMTPA